MINTIIVEDNKYIQKHFADLIASDERFHLTDVVADAFEAEKLCYKGIDLVLMDVLTLHRHSGLTAGRRIKEKWPKTKVVIITSLIDPDILAKAKAGCADSLWYKDHSSRELLEVIERTLAGERVFPDCSPVIELENMFSDEISPAQLEILR
ncbi:MAG: response regulator, partial [Porcipelethomonas sp.]